MELESRTTTTTTTTNRTATKRETIETEIVVTDKRGYQNAFILSQVVGLALLVIILVWIFNHLNGLAFNKPSYLFNFHPLLLVVSIILSSNGLLIFRTLRNRNKYRLKQLHALLNGCVIVLGGLGSAAAIVYHHQANIAHFYSLHSWLGIATWILYLSQFIIGFYSFLAPGASYKTRSFLLPFHRYIGAATFALAIATSLCGLNEKAIFSLPNYSQLPAAGILINVSALLLILYASLVVYCVTKPEFKRFPISKDLKNKN